MGNATSAGLGSEAPHDERDIRFIGGHNSDTWPYDIELAEEAKESKVVYRNSYLDSEVLRSSASYSGAKSYIIVQSGTGEDLRLPDYKSYNNPVHFRHKVTIGR